MMMADQVQVNGPPSKKFIDSINPDDPEYIREQQRPAGIKEDVREMERRKRVSLILNSASFREELEEIISTQIQKGPHPTSLIALQQITDMFVPQSRANQSVSSIGKGGGQGPIPIADIKSTDATGYVKGEKLARCKLATVYRLVDMHGWSGVHTHITLRVSQEHEHFLVNPYGYMYSEVTAASLVKINIKGETVATGSTLLGINKDEFTLHSAIHAARPSIRCIIHLNTPSASAVSAMKCGLQPLCHEAVLCGRIAYHEYRGAPVLLQEADEIRHSLGPFSKVLFLRNHGFVAIGETVEEAWYYARNCALACETLLNCLALGVDELYQPDEETLQKMMDCAKHTSSTTEEPDAEKKEINWSIGQREFEAMIRWMDNAGYRTGYIYRQPVVKPERFQKRFEDVEVPPSATSVQEMLEDAEQTEKSPAQRVMEAKKKSDKTKWLNKQEDAVMAPPQV